MELVVVRASAGGPTPCSSPQPAWLEVRILKKGLSCQISSFPVLGLLHVSLGDDPFRLRCTCFDASSLPNRRRCHCLSLGKYFHTPQREGTANLRPPQDPPPDLL